MLDWPVFIVVSTVAVSLTMVVGVTYLRMARRPAVVLDNGIRHPGTDGARRRMGPVLDPHTAAPPREFTITEAHNVMQEHRTCGVDDCARKAAAFATLVAKGRVKPDSSRNP